MSSMETDQQDLRRQIVRVQTNACRLARGRTCFRSAGDFRHAEGPTLACSCCGEYCAEELDESLSSLLTALDCAVPVVLANDAYWHEVAGSPCIGFLFPGQGGQANASGGRLWARFRASLAGVDVTALNS